MWLFLVAGVVALFALGALLGAPFLPTHRHIANQALDLLDLKAGQVLLDVGAGSGTVLLLAAQRGIKAIGYELNPILYLIAKARSYRYRQLIDVRLADFWHSQWPPVDGVYVFLIARFMAKLDTKLQEELYQPTLVVSYIFKIPGRPIAQYKNGLYLYRY